MAICGNFRAACPINFGKQTSVSSSLSVRRVNRGIGSR
jgi:hypothetical protein